MRRAVIRASLIGFITMMCVGCAFPVIAQEAVTVTSVPGNPWSYNSELIFKQGEKEIASQRTDVWGNITPVSGTVPDGLVKGYSSDGKLIMEIPFKHNHAEGIGHSFYQGSLEGDERYRKGMLNGTRTGYYSNGRIKTQGEWRNGRPVGLHKLFDEQGHLQMTTVNKGKTRTETRFYPNKLKKSAWTYKDDKLVDAREYGEDGVLRVHATKHATLNQCHVSMDKTLYSSRDAVGFSLVCGCQGAAGCFSPDVDYLGRLRLGWTKHLVIERDGAQYEPVYCPMSAIARVDLSNPLFKNGEKIAHALYPIQEPNGCGTRWVDRTAYSACSDHIDCIFGVFEHAASSLPPGDYAAWLDVESKPAKVSFKIEPGK